MVSSTMECRSLLVLDSQSTAMIHFSVVPADKKKRRTSGSFVGPNGERQFFTRRH